jgi:hypothetical protein
MSSLLVQMTLPYKAKFSVTLHLESSVKKILAIAALFLIGLLVGTGYHYWKNATSLPEWYQSSTSTAPVALATATASPTSSPRSASVIQEKIKTAQPGVVQEQLTAPEVDNLIIAGLTKNSGKSRPLPSAIKGVKTQIQQNQIQTGAIVDLAAIEQMPPSPRTEMIRKILQVMPQLRGQPVYIGVAGRLAVKDGQPQLAADSKLQIGKVELPLDDVARQLGMSRSAVEKNLTSYLQFRDLNIDKIDLTDQGAVITGRKK